jgi:DltD protein
MRQFLKKIGLVVIIIVMAWMCLELFYRTAPNNYTEKNKNIIKAYDKCEVLIFGNSHAFYGLNPDYFEKETFNMANISQTIFYDKLLFEKHADSLKILQYIIQPVEYSSLSHKDNEPELKWRNCFYENQMGVGTGLDSEYDIRKYSLALAPPFRITINSVAEYLKTGTYVECAPNGFGSLYGTDTLQNTAKAGKFTAAKHEDGSLDFTNNVARLDRMIKKCNEKGVKVILVTMPVTSYYADNVNPVKFKKIIAQCTKLSLKKNVHYLNLFQDKRFTNSDFHDVDHLNTEGAKKCSKIVNDFLVSIERE